MQTETVRAIFRIMSGVEDVQSYEALIGAAMEEIKMALRPDCDSSSVHLHLLAAATANCAYREIQAAQAQTACTYAGTVAQQSDLTKQVEAAQKLVKRYRTLCSHLLRDAQFCFYQIHHPVKEEQANDTTDSATTANTAASGANDSVHSV